jgi:arginine N-succinyltransferase
VLVLRAATLDDLDAVHALAVELNTVNLPGDRRPLRDLLTDSAESFARDVEHPRSERYLFVLEDNGSPIGCSQIIASHGTVEDPHHSFWLDQQERYSATLGAVFRHRLLRFRTSYTPHTELAGLILAEPHRGRTDRPGRLLVFGRLLFVAQQPHRFHDELQAELLPPFEEGGVSVLWEWIGRQFTGLNYPEADQLSRTHPEFLRALFPHDPIHIGLLPPHVQDVIGRTGPSSRGVETLLRRAGFAFNGHVDPFDGGPHFSAQRSEIPMIRDAAEWEAVASVDPPSQTMGPFWVLSRNDPFRAVRVPARVEGGRLHVSLGALDALAPERAPARPGDTLRTFATEEPGRATPEGGR